MASSSPPRDLKARALPLLTTTLQALLPPLLLLLLLGFVLSKTIPSLPGVPRTEVTFERVFFEEGRVVFDLRNTGSSEVEISQVLVNDRIVEAHPLPLPLPRLARGEIEATFGWVEGEPVSISVLTSEGLKFTHTVEFPVSSSPFSSLLVPLAFVGAYVGLLPVFFGLFWRPLVDRASERGLHFVLGLTVGLLLFLASESLLEGWEKASEAPSVFKAPLLLAIVALGAFLVLEEVSKAASLSDPSKGGVWVSFLVALGIGIHNFAEGLAIGGALSIGSLALGTALILGFAIHNTTEGLALVAPLRTHSASWALLFGLGALAGGPTILGTWVGAFSPTPLVAALFLGVGGGALLQVSRLIWVQSGGELSRGWGRIGVILGVVGMYGTALLVPA